MSNSAYRPGPHTYRRELATASFVIASRGRPRFLNTKAKAAPSVHKTIFDYEKSAKGRGTEDFTKLTDEFLERLSGVMPTRKVVNG